MGKPEILRTIRRALSGADGSPYSVIKTSVLLLALMILVSCAVNPVTQQRELMLLSRGQELALGKQTDQEILNTYGFYKDENLNLYINEIGRRIGSLSHQPDLEYSFKILDSAVVNAFAVPGGFVYTTRGILVYLNDEAELTGVLGHEVGHVAARHSAQLYSRVQLAQIGLGVGAVLSKTVRQYAGVAEAGLSLLFLSFSRDNERQADDLGVLYSSKAGYDGQRMSNLFVTLQRLNPGEGQNGLPSWLSTHPDPPDRIEAIKKAASEWQAANPDVKVSVNRDQYLRNLEGLIFGEDPRQGYVEGQVFYHPELRFQFPVPANWKLNNTPSQVQMVAKENDGAMLLSIASEKTPAAAAEAFISATKAVLIEQGDEKIGGFLARRLLFDVTTDQGQIRGLACFIQKDEYVYFFLGYATPARFSVYSAVFNQSMKGFKELSDVSKINVKPERLTIKKITTSKTLGQALQEMGVPQNRLKELAILNGMELEDKVPAGTLIKTVTK